MIAKPLPVRSTIAPRTINKGTFISALRYCGEPRDPSLMSIGALALGLGLEFSEPYALFRKLAILS